MTLCSRRTALLLVTWLVASLTLLAAPTFAQTAQSPPPQDQLPSDGDPDIPPDGGQDIPPDAGPEEWSNRGGDDLDGGGELDDDELAEFEERGEPVELESSWPQDGGYLWVPSLEARLSFNGPVSASTLQVDLRDGDGQPAAELDRTTRGEAVTTILLSMPTLEPGEYTIVWAVDDTFGNPLSGEIVFHLDERFTAPGGGNHRHGVDHIYFDSAADLLSRVLLLVGASVLLLNHLRHRQRVYTLFDAVASRAASLSLIVGSFIYIVAGIVDAINEYYEQPALGAISSQGLWLLLPLIGGALGQLVTGRTDRYAAGLGAGTMVALGGMSHVINTPHTVATVPTYVVLLGATLVAFVQLGRLLTTPPQNRSLVPVAAASVTAAAASMLMLVLHASSLQLIGAFARDGLVRGGAAVLLAVALGLAVPLKQHRRLVALPAALLTVALVALLWTPPPAPGI